MSKKSQSATLISLKELASQLNVADALLKKHIRDFEIKVEKVKNRSHLDEVNIEVVKEIIKLKEAGKTTNDIKAILQHVRKQEEVQKQSPSLSDKELREAKKAQLLQEKNEQLKKESKAKKEAASKPETQKAPEKKQEAQQEKVLKPEKEKRKSNNAPKLDPELEKANEMNIDLTEYLRDEAVENETLDGPNVIEAIEEEMSDLSEGSDEEELEEETGPREFGSQEGVRRKAFNFRYVQRQIADDSRRVNHIKHRLTKSNISTIERLQLEESLEKRSKLLNGWVHILRWIKSRSGRR